MRDAVAVALALWTMLRFTHFSQHQTAVGVDAPINLEAAGARGQLDGPWFGTRQTARGIYWAYNGPRPLLFLFWPFAGLWKRKESLANGLVTLLFSAMTVWAVWLLWPSDLGWWIVPTLVILKLGYGWNMDLGMANPVVLILGALAYTVPDPWVAWMLVGVAVSMRLHGLLLVPLVWMFRGAGVTDLLLMAVAWTWATGLAYFAGFGQESPRRMWRLLYALQVKAKYHGKPEMALHLRRAYWVLIPLLWPWPIFAGACASIAIGHALIVDNRRTWGPVPVDLDAAVRHAGPVWHESWRD